jgi:hypothetical protein
MGEEVPPDRLRVGQGEVFGSRRADEVARSLIRGSRSRGAWTVLGRQGWSLADRNGDEGLSGDGEQLPARRGATRGQFADPNGRPARSDGVLQLFRAP